MMGGKIVETGRSHLKMVKKKNAKIMFFRYFVNAVVFASNCLMMIFKHSSQAPRRFSHLIHGMSHFEMSGHDTKVGSFDLILLPNQIFCAHCIKNILEGFPKLL